MSTSTRSGLVGRNAQLSKAGPRTARHEPDVIRNLVQRNREGAQRARKLNESVVRSLHRELVGSAGKRKIRKLGDFRGGSLAESWCRISSQEFFCLAVDHTMQGFYGDPRHGGNREGASWKMLGIPYPPIRGRLHYDLNKK
jgi:hypothetical protein